MAICLTALRTPRWLRRNLIFCASIGLCLQVSASVVTAIQILIIQFRQQRLHPSDALLEIHCLNCAQLQVQEGGQDWLRPSVRLACVYFCDQLRNGISHGSRILQFGQGRGVFRGGEVLAPAPDTAEFGGLLGIGVEKTSRPRLRQLGRACRSLQGPYNGSTR
jgi:hypothetical protein